MLQQSSLVRERDLSLVNQKKRRWRGGLPKYPVKSATINLSEDSIGMSGWITLHKQLILPLRGNVEYIGSKLKLHKVKQHPLTRPQRIKLVEER